MSKKHPWFLILATCLFLILIAAVSFAPLLTSYDPLAIRMDRVLQPPGSGHILGTDELGRDVFARLLYGGRVSLSVGAAAMFVSIVAGVVYGAISGLAGGKVDRLMMRVIDALLSIPSLLLMIGLQMVFPASLTTVILVISLTSWMPIARLIRTEILAMKQEVFIQASTVVGASTGQLLRRHMLPQCIPTITVLAISGISHAILAEATLSFLGIGIPPHEPSWGNMLMGAQSHLLAGAWWLAVFPGICITYTILVINFLGDKLQDRMAAPQFRKGRENERVSS
ncbi:ABC transporter permease subunit [Bacillus aerolatus]|uniref:ABC transporter permease subunit n=1 Tax=Bacillus aerolatus TaxID=2653354 RepID=A0A6I1FEF7_9BACI|nr:ABC transporter permease [Bacillus aerolatus]KAB7706155.1 ABC transporter permease subunit [Bacillus aerolatus]